MYYCYFFCVNFIYMDQFEINDIRKIIEFKGITFSKYKKSDVKKELLNCIIKNKVESACNWCAELVCAGQYTDIWEIILLALGKYIHLGNPKLPIYIEMRFNNFKEIIQGGYVDNELSLRNNIKIRTLFCETISMLCLSNQKPSFEIIKIKRAEEFNLRNMATKLKAPDVSYGNKVFKQNDPKELFIALNELAFHLSTNNKNLLQSCYWVEWIMEYDNLCKKQKNALYGERRSFAPVKESEQMDIIWIIWELLIQNSTSGLITRILNSLLNLFSIRFTSSCKQKRRYILYFAIELVTEKVNVNISMISSENSIIIKNINKKINNIYKNIKKNEIAPATDYLFNGLKNEKTNLEKTIEKLDVINNLYKNN